jgi:hypothetical protein
VAFLKSSSSPLVVWIVLDACRYDIFWDTPTLMRDMAARGLRLSAFLTGRFSTRNGTSVLAPPEAKRTSRNQFGIDLLQMNASAPTVFGAFEQAGYALLSRGVRVFGDDYDYTPWRFFRWWELTGEEVCGWLNQRAGGPALYFFHTPLTHLAWGLNIGARGNWDQKTFVVQFEKDPETEDRRMREFTVNGLRRIDETEFQPLVRELARSGRLAHTTFVIHADHGGTFSEFVARRANYDMELCGRGVWHHNCWDETLRVPAAIFGPGVPEEERGEVTCLVDLLPTLAALRGVALDPDLDGVDLLSPAGRISDRRACFEGHMDKVLGVRTAREKLVYNLERRQSLLFDLAADPGELQPTIEAPDDHPLWAALTAYAGCDVRGASAAADAAIHRRLKDLGYVD